MSEVSTGVPNLDLVLGGGLEPGSVIIISGAGGTGKTILAQQICFAIGTPAHHAVYYTTLSEPHSKLVRHLAVFDFFEQRALGSRVEYIHLGDLVRQDATDGLGVVFAEVLRQAIDDQPAVVVIDAANGLRDGADARALRSAYFDLISSVANTNTVLFLVGEFTKEEIAGNVEFALADGIIELSQASREPAVDLRSLRVTKMRGRRHLEGKHTFRITSTGIEIFPRIEVLDPGPAAVVSGRINSGVPELDELMGGGIGAGEATAILGPSGVGKTTLGLHFVTAGIAAGQGCLYVTFQDNGEELLRMASGFGFDLELARVSGQLVVHHVPLGELDLDILTENIRRELLPGTIQRIVIDSLAEMVIASREAERFPAYVRSLIALIRHAGATLVVTSETATLGPTPEPVGGVSFLFHNVIMLRYLELSSTTGRALNISKMRTSGHDRHVHEFSIGSGGVTIGDVLHDITGVLGWSALRVSGHRPGDATDAIERSPST